MAETCKECGCKCGTCSQDGQQQQQQHCDMHLHVEIEDLRQRLLERDNHIVTMETQFLSEADKFPNGELASMREELSIWQEKYSRLHEAHKRVQKVNQNLEDKLLRIVDKCETEKGAFTKDIATLSHRLADANYTIHRLTQDNEKYRNDVNLAIQLLQCKPSNFVGQKYDSLPTEVQAKVRTYVAQKRCPAQDATQQDVKSITVPISTFPPTAMVYNVTKPTVEKHSDDDSEDERPPVDVVSAAIMAKVLEDREKERVFARHCDTCTCHRSILTVDAETQTCAPDAPPFSQGHSVDGQALEGVPGSETHPSRDNKLQPSLATIFYEVNESGDRARHQVNGDCSKHAPQPVRDKLGKGGRGAQDGATEEGCAKAGLSKKNPAAHDGKRSPSFSKLNDLNRINADKASKALRASNSRSCDGSSADGRSAARCWSKSERGTFGPIGSALDSRVSDKEQTHVDIINDRLWKNEWTKTRGEKTGLATREGRPSDIELDVINDRDWRNDRPAERGAARFAVIEVKSPDNGAASQNDGSQTEATTTSPSFSSDSMLISSSDPSSSCSDVAQPLNGTFNSGSASSGQTRAAGPRNCLVRVTPGSKNILLDNAGHYKAVVYSSGGKASTALVHAKKGSRAGSERSISTGSEDNSPLVLLQDNHLQRVAEWVQSSMRAEEPAQFASNKAKRAETGASAPKSPGVREPRDASRKSSRRTEDRGKNRGEHNEGENLITFDAPEERRPSKEPRGKDLDYEVKITKEMEETYLKLAASLDPVALSLTSAGDAELTIEKYRKDHKRLHVQRVQDKAGSKA